MHSFFQLLLIAVSLAFDALSVSIAGGITSHKSKLKHALIIAFTFGLFQALMPLLGLLLGNWLSNFFIQFGPWIAFLLLTGIGIKLIHEAFTREEGSKRNLFAGKTLFTLAFATSVDAFLVGITLPLMKMPFLTAIITIGLVTFVLCFLGFVFGKQLGKHFSKRIEIIGGLVLIGIGVKILLEGIL